FFFFSSRPGDVSVVVPGQWRRIIGSSQKAATLKFTFFANRSLFRQFRPKWINTDRFSLKTYQFQARG
ncbi:hypothetical protein, partial [Rahnella aquatilis]|uniref:hypothetical protein n=1 Tax=Rahnella aquatilis TaxID=34038 RepID=UPI001B8077BE